MNNQVHIFNHRNKFNFLKYTMSNTTYNMKLINKLIFKFEQYIEENAHCFSDDYYLPFHLLEKYWTRQPSWVVSSNPNLTPELIWKHWDDLNKHRLIETFYQKYVLLKANDHWKRKYNKVMNMILFCPYSRENTERAKHKHHYHLGYGYLQVEQEYVDNYENK